MTYIRGMSFRTDSFIDPKCGWEMENIMPHTFRIAIKCLNTVLLSMDVIFITCQCGYM